MAGEVSNLNLYFLLAHFMLLLIYVLVFRDKHKQHFVCELLILLFLPIVGFILLIYSKWLRQRLQSFGIDKDKQEHLDKLLEQDKNTETISAQIKQGSDVVALNDVLYLEDVSDKRKLLTTAIRQSALDDSSILRRAIRDEDRDVSHYAVSMATNNLSIMEKQVHKIEVQWKQQLDNIGYLKEYAELLRSYTAMGILEEYTLEKLNTRYEKILERILLLEDNEYFLENLIEVLIARGSYEKAETILNSFNDKHPELEQGYLLLLKIYVMQKRNKDVVKLLSQLKQSKVHFSAEGMKLIRFWGSGVNNA